MAGSQLVQLQDGRVDKGGLVGGMVGVGRDGGSNLLQRHWHCSVDIGATDAVLAAVEGGALQQGDRQRRRGTSVLSCSAGMNQGQSWGQRLKQQQEQQQGGMGRGHRRRHGGGGGRGESAVRAGEGARRRGPAATRGGRGARGKDTPRVSRC